MSVAITHRLPGRIRIDIEEMHHQPIVAYKLQRELQSLKGILRVECNAASGRALICFDANLLQDEQVLRIVQSKIRSPYRAVQLIASTTEETLPKREESLPKLEESLPKLEESRLIPSVLRENLDKTQVRDHVHGVPQIAHDTRNQSNPYRIPAIASVGLLGLLSVKRLLVGRSVLAAAPIPFYAAAGVSIAAGYPAVRRGIEGLFQNRRANPDLWIGIATLSLAVLRENLVALSAIALLNLAMFRRHSVLQTPEPTHLDPELEGHSKQMGRMAKWMAPLALFTTGSPLRSLGVLLAANPRPAQLAHKYRWANLERQAIEKKLPVPKRGNLSALASARTIVLLDGTSVSEEGNEWDIQILQEGMDEDKAMALAASLLQKTDHPWKEYLTNSAIQNNRTLRTPFKVQALDDGIHGILNGHETLFGAKEFIKKMGVDLDPVLLAERRMRKEGYKTGLLVQEGKLLALFGCKQQLCDSWKNQIEHWEQQGYEVRCLLQDEHIPCPVEMVSIHEVNHQLSMGKPIVMIGDQECPLDSPHLVCFSTADLSSFNDLLSFCKDANEQVKKDLQIVQKWNKAGPFLAWMAPVAAPIINLLADTLGVFLVSRQNWRFNGRRQSQVEDLKQSVQLNSTRHLHPYHALGMQEALQAVGGSLQGLTEREAINRRRKFGMNRLLAPPAPNPLQVFIRQFKDFATLILLGAAGMSFGMGETFNALCMGGVLLLNALIGTWQELRSANVLHAIKTEDDLKAKVLRDGTEKWIDSADLVPGDVVLLEAGDLVPADLRVAEEWNLEVNEAMLTGESVPVSKQVQPVEEDAALADRKNLIYMGTIVTRGRAKAIVVATGVQTQIGALQSLLQDQPITDTPIQERISMIGKQFVKAAFIAGGIVVAAGLLRGIPPGQLMISAVTLVASAIPEGLPLIITSALTAGVMRMSKRKAVVRKLSSLEALGRVTVICSDKTGTLTRNEMTVKELATSTARIGVTGDGYIPEGTFYSLEQGINEPYTIGDDAKQLLLIGLLCNNASNEPLDSRSALVGDPTERAILTASLKAGLKSETWTRHREIPFDSNTGSMSVVCENQDGANECMLLTKGSPEVILRNCTHYLVNGKVEPITEIFIKKMEDENKRMAERALRVLGFAYRSLNQDEKIEHVQEDGLIFVGLMGMIDPPKEDVAKSIQAARVLGIKPVMITGDHPITAQAIGRELGIYRPGDQILTGRDLECLSAMELDKLVKETSIFARVSPEHKLRIVEAYQRNGEIVAMTGDGVNDAPAIRKADVGIAMGSQGTDLTKDTAGIVLLEDHFHSIIEGVKEGRKIIGNIRKSIGCLITGNLAEILVATAAVVMGLPMPLVPLQILLMNLLTDGLPAIVLATNARETGAEEKRQEVVDRSLYRTVITRGSILGLGALGMFAGSLAMGIPLPVAQTMAFSTLVAGQLIQTVSWRRLDSTQAISLKQDRPLVSAMGASWLALIACIYLPGLQGIFATVPLRVTHWAAILAVSSSVTRISGTLLSRRDLKSAAPKMMPSAA